MMLERHKFEIASKCGKAVSLALVLDSPRCPLRDPLPNTS